MQVIAELVARVSGKKLDVYHNTTMPSSLLYWRLDCSRAMADLGWQPRVAIGDGIQLTYDWYRSVLRS